MLRQLVFRLTCRLKSAVRRRVLYRCFPPVIDIILYRASNMGVKRSGLVFESPRAFRVPNTQTKRISNPRKEWEH